MEGLCAETGGGSARDVSLGGGDKIYIIWGKGAVEVC